MKIVSYNINGIRASAKLGLIDWIKDFDADIYCFQEVRAKKEIVNELLQAKKQLSLFNTEEEEILKTYYPTYNCGEVAGYAGTLILTKIKPDIIYYDMGNFWKDNEGRTTTLIFNNIAIVNVYIPNGNSRLEFKMQYLEALNKYLRKLQEHYKTICVGDFNIAHNEIDLTNPKECKNKSVFLPIERKAFDDLMNIGMVDVFRYLYPDKVEFTWRSYRSRYDNGYNSWKYRIDYILISNNLINNISDCSVLDLDYSDHLPVVAELKIKF